MALILHVAMPLSNHSNTADIFSTEKGGLNSSEPQVICRGPIPSRRITASKKRVFPSYVAVESVLRSRGSPGTFHGVPRSQATVKSACGGVKAVR